jgi:hypothetical protein
MVHDIRKNIEDFKVPSFHLFVHRMIVELR